jgi:ribose transport system substrate-binding protein
MKRLIASWPAAALCLTAGVLIGCAKDKPAGPGAGGARRAASAPATGRAAVEKARIALVMKSLANEFFKTMEDGARAHQKAHAESYDLIANGIKDEQDVARQIAIVEQMIAQEMDAIVIAPADSKALVPACKRAMDAGIVVVNIDNKFDDAALADKKVKIPFVGPDNRKGARLAAEHLAKRLAKGDEVAIVEGVPNAFNAVQRKLGFQDAMNAAGAKIASSQSANWMPDQAERVVAGMLVQHPDLKAILCANDNMALGAVAALKAAGKAGKVLVVGYDNISAVQKLMKEGRILCTIDQHADRIAVYGIEYALEILRKKTTPADKETPVDLKTADDVR